MTGRRQHRTRALALGLFAVMAMVSPRLTLVCAVVLPFLVGSSIYFQRRIHPIFIDVRRQASEVAGRLTECLQGLNVIKAFERGPASVIAPFDYGQLIGTTILGYLIFGDFPDLWTWVGAAVIVGSGLYILHREATLKRAPGAPKRS